MSILFVCFVPWLLFCFPGCLCVEYCCGRGYRQREGTPDKIVLTHGAILAKGRHPNHIRQLDVFT